MKQIKTFKIKDIEDALKEFSKHNGFEWNYWLIPLIKLYLKKNERDR